MRTERKWNGNVPGFESGNVGNTNRKGKFIFKGIFFSGSGILGNVRLVTRAHLFAAKTNVLRKLNRMDTVARKFYNKHKDEANEELPITPWEDVIARKPEALKYPCMCLQFCAKEPVEQSYVTAAQRLGFYRVLRLIQGHNFNFYGFLKTNFLVK